MSDPTCGIDNFGVGTDDATFDYPADDLVLCTRNPGLRQ